LKRLLTSVSTSVGNSDISVSEIPTSKARKIRFDKKALECFSVIVDSVLYDVKLSSKAKLVYAVLAGDVRDGNVASMSYHLIAEKLGLHRESIGLAIEELKERKHITVVQCGQKRRRYILTSNRFGWKQREGIETIVAGPRGSKRLATVDPNKR